MKKSLFAITREEQIKEAHEVYEGCCRFLKIRVETEVKKLPVKEIWEIVYKKLDMFIESRYGKALERIKDQITRAYVRAAVTALTDCYIKVTSEMFVELVHCGKDKKQITKKYVQFGGVRETLVFPCFAEDKIRRETRNSQ